MKRKIFSLLTGQFTEDDVAPPPVSRDDVIGVRNHLLDKSDWTQMPDAKADRLAWAKYRQSLRDITAQPGFPENVIWPKEP